MVDATPEPPYEDPCVVYRPLDTDGGLERYVSTLAKTLEAPVYTPRQTIRPDHFEDVDVRIFERARAERVVDRLPIGSVAEFLTYENFEVPTHHDAVVTVGESTKAVIHQPYQHRVHLLNMPPRWLFDLGPGRFDGHGIGGFLKRLYQSIVRVHDVSTIRRIDEFVVPSEVIGRRLETYYNRTAAAVVYPPADTGRYHHEEGDGYLLYLGRLAEAKRVGEIVGALSGTDHQLKIAGTGPLEDELSRHAGRNVEVLGYVSDERKRELLANCDAVVFNSDREAFGIVPVEAFASGKPVIGVDEGYTQYQIEDGVNGVSFERGELVEAVEAMYDQEWDADAIQVTAGRYDVSTFRQAWQSFLFGTP
jgi:glycosyltransferase involved in cell wall biosynthesis